MANLYYSQPLLSKPLCFVTYICVLSLTLQCSAVQLSRSFNVTYDEVSRIPTLTQAGYAIDAGNGLQCG